MCIRIIRLIVDFIMIMKFIHLYHYFLRQKLDSLYLKMKKITRFNKFVICWSILVITVNIGYILLAHIFNIQRFTFLSENKQFLLFGRILEYYIITSSNFLTGLTLFYLFYYQSMSS